MSVGRKWERGRQRERKCVCMGVAKIHETVGIGDTESGDTRKGTGKRDGGKRTKTSAEST